MARYALGILSIGAKFLININRHAFPGPLDSDARDALVFTVHANYAQLYEYVGTFMHYVFYAYRCCGN